MNKRTILWTLGIIILIGIGVTLAIVFPANKPVAPQSPTRSGSSQPTSPPSTEPSKVQPGTYQAYSQQAYNESSNTRRILFFHAPWCPQCRQLDKEISAATVPNGITIFKVDYDTNQPLRAKYGVTLQTTFVEVDASDTKIKNLVAYDEPTYVYLSKQLSF